MMQHVQLHQHLGLVIARSRNVNNIVELQVEARAMLAHADSAHVAGILFDMRKLRSSLTLREADAIADGLIENKSFGRIPIAFLAAPGIHFEMLRMISSQATAQGATAAAFTKWQDLLRWIRANGEHASAKANSPAETNVKKLPLASIRCLRR